MWNLFKVNNEDTRGMSIFLNVSMSMRSIWWIQLYLNFFQHYLSIIYFIWYTARYMMRQTCVPPNITRCTKLRGTQCHKKIYICGWGEYILWKIRIQTQTKETTKIIFFFEIRTYYFLYREFSSPTSKKITST